MNLKSQYVKIKSIKHRHFEVAMLVSPEGTFQVTAINLSNGKGEEFESRDFSLALSTFERQLMKFQGH